MTDQDPIVMYMVVRESLDMSAGKVGAQCGHATQHMLLKYFKLQMFAAALKHNHKEDALNAEDNEHIKTITEWVNHGSTKVVLKADEREWETLKTEFGKNCFVIIDAGHTQVSPGTETVMTFFPDYKSKVSKSIRRLQLL